MFRPDSAQRGRCLVGAGRAGAVVLLRRDVGPVSYTHLRAHETVLDIVCRLLLEKKKEIQTDDL